MEQNLQTEQKESGIDLSTLFKMLLDKIKLLIFIFLAGILAGCALGVITTYDTHYYGTKLEYYVNPKRSTTSTDNQSQYGVYGAYGTNIMDNMVKLLQSESFAEKLLLDDLGLPRRYLADTEYNKIAAIINEANDAVAHVNTLKDELKELTDSMDKLKEEEATQREIYNFAMETKNRAEDLYITLQSNGAGSAYVAEQREKVLKAEAEAELAKADYDKAREAYSFAKDEEERLDEEIKVADKKALATLKSSDAEVEKILVEWRKTPTYQSQLSTILGAISYSYLDGKTEASEANNFARSFFYVNIEILNDMDFASFLLERIKAELPEYIEANMIVPAGYEGTNCLLTTRVEAVRDMNPGLMRTQVIKYGLLLGVAALVATCLIIFLTENSNRKLRDYDELTTNLNLPVLGVIPSLELLDPTFGVTMKKVESNKGGDRK